MFILQNDDDEIDDESGGTMLAQAGSRKMHNDTVENMCGQQ